MTVIQFQITILIKTTEKVHKGVCTITFVTTLFIRANKVPSRVKWFNRLWRVVIMNTMQLLNGITYADNMGETLQVVVEYVQHFLICFRK